MIALINEKTFLILIAATGYGVATILIKSLSDGISLGLSTGLALVLLVTVVAEVALLKKIDLGLAYVAIIATETLLVLGYAYFVDEGLSGHAQIGAMFVIVGAILVGH